jgi:hypothetical protein
MVLPPTLMCARSSYLKKPQKPRADGCSHRMVTQPGGWPFSKHPAGSSTLSKGMGSFLLSPERKVRLAYSLMAATMGALVTSVCDAKLWKAAIAAEASLIVEKEFAVCASFSRYSATVSSAAGRNGSSCPVHQSLKYPHRGTYRLMVESAFAPDSASGNSCSSCSMSACCLLSSSLTSALRKGMTFVSSIAMLSNPCLALLTITVNIQYTILLMFT